MKIILWAPLGAGKHYWGPGTNAFRLYKSCSQVDNKNKVTLVHASKEQGLFPHVFDKQVNLGNLRPSTIFNTLIFLFRSKRFIKKNHTMYDIFHGIGGFETTFGPAITWSKAGKPAFIKITGSNGGFGNNSRISTFLGIAARRKRLINAITGYIAISKDIEKNLIDFGVAPEKIHLIPNGVDTEVFHPVSKEEKVKGRKELELPDKRTFIFVGGLTPNKQQFKCVEAIARLIEEGFDIQMVLLGPDRSNGLEWNKIEGFLKLHPQHRQRFIHIEFSSSPERYYQASDYFLLTSKSEGMPNALLEAMASRLPCIVTPIAGSIDLITDKINGLHTLDTVEEIRKACKYLLENENAATVLAENAYLNIQQNYSSSEIYTKHMNLFRQSLIDVK